jgi:hypothetical protein
LDFLEDGQRVMAMFKHFCGNAAVNARAVERDCLAVPRNVWLLYVSILALGKVQSDVFLMQGFALMI